MSIRQLYIKRCFDLAFATLALSLFWWVILICWILSSVDTRSNGFFLQKRVGRYGKHFSVIKIKTMKVMPNYNTVVTTTHDPRITRIGQFFRTYKLDELPQLWNVFVGEMSFVGPRPDVPGYADCLPNNIKSILLSVRPGITCPASLSFRNEEELLAQQADPQKYNDEVIYPQKVQSNLNYILNWSFYSDCVIIFKTLFPFHAKH